MFHLDYWQTRTRCDFALIFEIMKDFTLGITGILIILALATLQAREPVRDVKDLLNLESQVKEVSRKAMPATVALLADETGSSGSGVITTADGLILTAAHVVQGVEEVLVVFPDGEEVRGKVLGANFSKDIAMVQISKKGVYPFAAMGASKVLAAGDWVVAMGHSAGFDAARTPPVRFGRVVSKGPGNFLTTDCTLIGGDSGGPLFDLDGKIVGINSSIGFSLKNNNHAGVDGIRQDWDRLKAGEAWGELQMNPFANPDLPVLGLVGGTMQFRGIRGAVVGGVSPRSPAAAAGIRAGDVIVAVDSERIQTFKELTVLIAKREAGDRVKLDVQRESGEAQIMVTLARMDDLYGSR